ncbi:putative 2-carboxy-D-arabinitol-1-phosphatase [Zea mays]|uniref:Putative 2-carboxy-D-arabinitol-1-phosphatase n=1 Tax=Zea mays TaxID=4577 RepID=A0A1D6QHN0_MAIZE|nr:putative 2-carboxy-D-arabinitol-1-phosphatase [Zea mays]
MSSEPTMHSTLTNLMEYSTPHQVSGNQQHGYSGDGRPRGTSGGESDSDDDALLFLAVPAGWLVRLLAFLGELVASAILGLVFPVAALVGALRALPAAAASSLRRVARGLLAVLAVCWVRPLVLSARRRPSGVQEADGNLASGLGLVDMGDRPRKEASDCLAARWRARRSERKAQLRTRLHGGGMELEATEDSASSVAVVEREKEPGEAVNDP